MELKKFTIFLLAPLLATLSAVLYAMEGQGEPETTTSMELELSSGERKRKRPIPTNETEKEEGEPALKKLELTEEAGWDLLPVEVQLKILSYLPAITSYQDWLKLKAVSKGFRELLNEPAILSAVAKKLYSINPEGAHKLLNAVRGHKEHQELVKALREARKSLGIEPKFFKTPPIRREIKELPEDIGRLHARLAFLRDRLRNARPAEVAEIKKAIAEIQEEISKLQQGIQ